MKRLFPILGLLTAVLLSYGLYQALVVAPTEQTMGDVQRIFYYHVPSAWTAFLLFLINFVASLAYLIRRSVQALIVLLLSALASFVYGTDVFIRSVTSFVQKGKSAKARTLSRAAATTVPRPSSAAGPGSPDRNRASASSAVIPVSRVR